MGELKIERNDRLVKCSDLLCFSDLFPAKNYKWRDLKRDWLAALFIQSRVRRKLVKAVFGPILLLVLLPVLLAVVAYY